MTSAAKPQTARRTLSDGEIASLAATAAMVWDTGLDQTTTDSLGGVWAFNVIRDDHTRLEVVRVSGPPDQQVRAGTAFTSAEMGAHDNLDVLLASRILAVAVT